MPTELGLNARLMTRDGDVRQRTGFQDDELSFRENGGQMMRCIHWDDGIPVCRLQSGQCARVQHPCCVYAPLVRERVRSLEMSLCNRDALAAQLIREQLRRSRSRLEIRIPGQMAMA